MAAAGRATPGEYERIGLRAHTLLADAPLHDVWVVELPGAGPEGGLLALREALASEPLGGSNPAVRFLFGLRARLGAVFGWDREPPEAARESYLHRLTPAERESSLVEPGTREGPFRVLFVSPREAISEVRNATVHAFSVFALTEHGPGQRLYWAIHVKPVGRLTAWYMRLIDPFRHRIIYPAMLSRIRRVWGRGGTPRAHEETT